MSRSPKSNGPARLRLRGKRGRGGALTHLWRYLRTRAPEYQAFYLTSDSFEHFTGKPPRSLPQFLHEHKDLFAEAVAR